MDIQAFFKITYGLFIVSSKSNDGKFTAHISNTALQVTAEPPRFTVCSNKDNLTTTYIDESKIFSISVIQEDVNLNFIGHFGFKSGKTFDKFEKINYKIGLTGAPIVTENCVAYIECKVINQIDVGSHILFVGEVVDSQVLKEDTASLTYTYYRNVIKGVSPKNAPTYIDKTKHPEFVEKTEKEKEVLYKCQICGHIYNENEGDPDSGIPPGTKFEDLPDNWVCPVCGVTKDNFEKIIY
jgi:flavin reductase (DIM6/NTAB) family NADH-FMN oxidoreductase RutF/rubredoxin